MLLIVYMTANSHKCGQNKNSSVVYTSANLDTALKRNTGPKCCCGPCTVC